MLLRVTQTLLPFLTQVDLSLRTRAILINLSARCASFNNTSSMALSIHHLVRSRLPRKLLLLSHRQLFVRQLQARHSPIGDRLSA